MKGLVQMVMLGVAPVATSAYKWPNGRIQSATAIDVSCDMRWRRVRR